MRICGICGRDQDADDTGGCFDVGLSDRHGAEVWLTPYGSEPGSEARAGERCPDCNALYGHPHHLGCDIELCPFCGEEPFIGCTCQQDGENDGEMGGEW